MPLWVPGPFPGASNTLAATLRARWTHGRDFLPNMQQVQNMVSMVTSHTLKSRKKNTEGFSLFVAEYQLEPKCVLELADEGQAAGHGVLDMALTPSHIRG